MRAGRTRRNDVIMKKADKQEKVSGKRVTARLAPPKGHLKSDMRSHYDFDYSKARSNRFAERLARDTVTIVLDPDVADVFGSAEVVNAFLRSAINAMPQGDRGKRKRTRTAG